MLSNLVKLLLLVSTFIGISVVHCTEISGKDTKGEVKEKKWMKELDSLSNKQDKKSLSDHFSTTNHLVNPGSWSPYRNEFIKKSSAVEEQNEPEKRYSKSEHEERPPVHWRLGKRKTDQLEENSKRSTSKWVLIKRNSNNAEKENLEGPPASWRLGKRTMNVEERDAENKNLERPPIRYWRWRGKRSNDVEESGRPPITWIKGKRNSNDAEKEHLEKPPFKWLEKGKRDSKEEKSGRPPITWIKGKRGSNNAEKGRLERPSFKWFGTGKRDSKEEERDAEKYQKVKAKRSSNDVEESGRPPITWIKGKRNSNDAEKEHLERPPFKWLGKGKRDSKEEESGRPPITWIKGKRDSNNAEKERLESGRPPMTWVKGKRNSNDAEKGRLERPPFKWLGKGKRDNIEGSNMNERRENGISRHTVDEKRSSSTIEDDIDCERKDDKRKDQANVLVFQDRFLDSTFDEDMARKKEAALFASDEQIRKKRSGRPENPWLRLLYPERIRIPKRQIPWFDKKTTKNDKTEER